MNGPIAPALEADEEGWTRSEVWQQDDVGAGDYMVGPGFTSEYKCILPDGRVLACGVTHYVEVYDSDWGYGDPVPVDRCGPVERTETRTFASVEDYENGREAACDYQYEPIGYLNRSTVEAYVEEAREAALHDIRFSLKHWSDSERQKLDNVERV